ncbi:hypothetical protein DWS23_09075 [Escherichia coli]|nr:hypothetical protein [Escherichia coli]EFA4950302.1 hypothetical protein [Escherichia coli]EFO1474652.1 hypothetical protein [Escherichia coli]EFO1592436.1 hypothetical protein [Escherichia coli]
MAAGWHVNLFSFLLRPYLTAGFFISDNQHNPYHGYEIIHMNYQLINFMSFICFKIRCLIIMSLISLNFKSVMSIT